MLNVISMEFIIVSLWNNFANKDCRIKRKAQYTVKLKEKHNTLCFYFIYIFYFFFFLNGYIYNAQVCLEQIISTDILNFPK